MLWRHLEITFNLNILNSMRIPRREFFGSVEKVKTKTECICTDFSEGSVGEIYENFKGICRAIYE